MLLISNVCPLDPSYSCLISPFCQSLLGNCFYHHYLWYPCCFSPWTLPYTVHTWHAVCCILMVTITWTFCWIFLLVLISHWNSLSSLTYPSTFLQIPPCSIAIATFFVPATQKLRGPVQISHSRFLYPAAYLAPPLERQTIFSSSKSLKPEFPFSLFLPNPQQLQSTLSLMALLVLKSQTMKLSLIFFLRLLQV